MDNFKDYVRRGVVKKQASNKNRAKSLIKEAEDKKEYLNLSLKTIPKEKWNANFITSYGYDIIMELIRAKMFIDGYNAGNSHEAEVSYLEVLNFSKAEIIFMDELRYYRNGTKYYGTILAMEYANKVLEFLNKNYSRLRQIVEI